MTNKKTIILFNPLSSRSKGHKGAPLSLLAVAAPLQEEFNIKIIDEHVDENHIEKLLNHLKDALCVGITCMTGPQIKSALEVARTVKKKNSALPIIFGGWHATILPEETLKNELVDIVV